MENDKDENAKDIETKRADAVEELRAAFAELESGEGLTRFVGGHGIQSRVFELDAARQSPRDRARRRPGVHFNHLALSRVIRKYDILYITFQHSTGTTERKNV